MIRGTIPALLLSGCSLFGPTIPDVVRVPVPVPCVQSVPQRPTVLDEPALLALDDYHFAIGLDADRRAWRDHAKQLEATLIACKGDTPKESPP